VSETPGRALEVVPGRPETPPENAREQDAKAGGGLRAASWTVALVSAGVLVGGGIGMLAGVALGAINPFALGIVGAVVGIGVPVLFIVGARRVARRPWWKRVFGG
jgi:F0F1-type ATP synthase assembly protein I